MSILDVEKNKPVNSTIEGGKSKGQNSNVNKLFSKIVDNNGAKQK